MTAILPAVGRGGQVVYAAGADLTDAGGQAIHPGVTRSSQYTLKTALTANRSVDIFVDSMAPSQLIRFVRKALTGAFTLTLVNKGIGGGSFVFPVSPLEPQEITLYFNGVDLVLVGFGYLHS